MMDVIAGTATVTIAWTLGFVKKGLSGAKVVQRALPGPTLVQVRTGWLTRTPEISSE